MGEGLKQKEPPSLCAWRKAGPQPSGRQKDGGHDLPSAFL